MSSIAGFKIVADASVPPGTIILISTQKYLLYVPKNKDGKRV